MGRLSSGALGICLLGWAAVFIACSANSSNAGLRPSGAGGDASVSDGSSDVAIEGVGAQGGRGKDVGTGDVEEERCQPFRCSDDYQRILDCNGVTVRRCEPSELCANGACLGACEASTALRASVGCDYYPVMMAAAGWTQASRGCFAMFIANTWGIAAHIEVSRGNAPLDLSSFAFVPQGSGATLTYLPYDGSAGLAPGEVAILFLSGPPDSNPGRVSAECPAGVTPAITSPSVQVDGTGIGVTFHVTTDVPVVAYQMLPYGGGSAAVTGASLLLPTSVWDTNYVAVNAYRQNSGDTTPSSPSLSVVAMEEDTQVTVLPNVAVEGGGKIPSGESSKPLTFTLGKGEFAQITQPAELTGSPIQSTKPIALLAGHECMYVPSDTKYCDHAEQQIPPVRALANEYAAVPYRPRVDGQEDHVIWRIVGGVDGTELSFEPPSVSAETSVDRGKMVELASKEAFVVRSQDLDHPFMVFGYMTGSRAVREGYGDPDFVRMVPPRQYMSRYVLFTDPTYPETELVLVRTKGSDGFAGVSLDCGGAIEGWSPVGSAGIYEYARVDLVRHRFESVGGCENGAHEIYSSQPFGLWVWGWGTPETGEEPFTANVSYGYPAGENVIQLNGVVIPAAPK